MQNIPQIIQHIQTLYHNTLRELAFLLEEQFDSRVDITLLRILFREEQTSLEELELGMFELEIVYQKLRHLDSEIVLKQAELQAIDDFLDNI
jgi:hypothetical protein